MKIPKAVLNLVTEEEIKQLIKFQGTDLYKPYMAKLKEKYEKLYNLLD